MKKNILSICRRTAAVEGIEEVCLTTNGILLPQLGKDLREAGVNRINLSLDTLDPKKYTYITRIGKLDAFRAGLDAAFAAGFEKIKVNAVLIGGFNDDEIAALANLTRDFPLDMRFIELMPIQNHDEFGESAYVPYSRVLEKLPDAVPVDKDGGVA
ncbi:MAG: radical SAM protein, partial [Clostridia bacterium]|nr:radical SAM protein [Clostridia bacterium]